MAGHAHAQNRSTGRRSPVNPRPLPADRPRIATSSGELQATVPAEDPPPAGELGGDVMTVDEAAAFLRIGRNALYDAIGRGDVPHRRSGKTIRLSRSALAQWLGRSCGAASTRGL
jgi:excisionase family DNA binding protein